MTQAHVKLKPLNHLRQAFFLLFFYDILDDKSQQLNRQRHLQHSGDLSITPDCPRGQCAHTGID